MHVISKICLDISNFSCIMFSAFRSYCAFTSGSSGIWGSFPPWVFCLGISGKCGALVVMSNLSNLVFQFLEQSNYCDSHNF